MKITARDSEVRTKRYETFVLRLWVEADGAVDHGEIRHIGSNSVGRFRDLGRALAFIRKVIRPCEDDPA
jgi:hypothetical protein